MTKYILHNSFLEILDLNHGEGNTMLSYNQYDMIACHLFVAILSLVNFIGLHVHLQLSPN
jgi:hypothetical protein